MTSTVASTSTSVRSGPMPSAAPVAEAGVGSRCTELPRTATIGSASDPNGVELGGVVVDERGFFVGARLPKEQSVAVVRVPHDGAEAAEAAPGGLERWFMSATEGLRAPQLALGDGRLFVGTLGRSDKGWPLHVDVVAAPERPEVLFDVLEHIDESEWTSFAALRGGKVVAAWDEVDSTSNRGQVVVRAADGSTRVLTASQGDATEPQWIGGPEGPVALAWIAELEDSEAEDAEPSGGPVRTQRWVEAVVVDPQSGRVVGEPSALTRKTGHVQTVGLRWTAGGLVVLARDDERSGDGGAGRLTAVRALLEGPKLVVKESVVVVDRDVAFGVPSILVLGASTFGVHVREDDTARLVPLFGAGQAPTEEPSLRGRQVLSTWKDRVLTATPRGGEMVLRTVRCGESIVAP